MAITVGELVARFTADTKGLDAGLKAAETGLKNTAAEAGRTERATNNLSGGINDLVGSMIPFQLSLAGVAAGVGILAQQSIMAASDVEEMSSKFAIVFGESAPQAEEALGNLADTIGRSRFDLMGYAASIQDTLVPLGLARDEAAGLSVEIVALAEDLASFNNLNTADVMRALQSGLVGETEPLRQFGVVINQAAVEAQALEMGLIGVGDELNAQARALATYQLIIEGTSDAQGDAERTADGFANSMRALEAAANDLKVEIGQGLLPAATGLVKGLTQAADTVELLLTAHEQLGAAFEENEAQILATATSYDEYLERMNAAEEQVGWLHRALQLASFGPADLVTGLYNLATGAEQATISLQPMTEEAFEFERAVRDAAIADEMLMAQLSQIPPVAEEVGPALSALSGAFDTVYASVSALSMQQGLLNDALRAGAATALEVEQRKIALALATGQMTGAEAAGILQQLELNKALEEGRITFAEYIAIVKDGAITADEFAGAVGGVTSAADQAAAKVKELAAAIGALPDSKDITIRATVGALTTSGLEDAEIENIVNTQLGGARADGGPVVGGKSYLVGERGPEIVRMPASGYVTPNEAIGGQTVNVYFTNTTVMDNRMVDYITQQVARAIRN